MSDVLENLKVSVPTMSRKRLSFGRMVGVDGSVWLVRTLPMTPVVDARSDDAMVAGYHPLLAAYQEMADLAPGGNARRAVNKSNFRHTQLLVVNLAKMYRPDAQSPIAGYLSDMFPAQETQLRLALFAVRLKDKIGGNGSFKDAVRSVAETIVDGGTPIDDFDWDADRVHRALERCGMTIPSGEELALADSWWNQGKFPDTIDLAHSEHLHLFQDGNGARLAKKMGAESCEDWPSLNNIPGHRVLTFATVDDFDFEFVRPTDSDAHWATNLIEAGAAAVSVRASIEPAKVTRGELRRKRKAYLSDMQDASNANKMERVEMEEKVQTLGEIETVYATQGGAPTLVDASILVAFDGRVDDISRVGGDSRAILRIMNERQRPALAEMMLCSGLTANPSLLDLPSQTIACSGLQSLNSVGDSEGALLGFTERDRQPALESPTAASTSDGLPIMLNAGATGSGKSQLLLWKAVQFSRMGRPVVIIDPKTDSDHSPTVLAAGGQVSSLDDFASADGIFDPIRFSSKIEVGVEIAVSMLASIRLWRDQDREVDLYNALSYGVRNGARCVGEALRIAYNAGQATLDLVDPVRKLAEASPMFRACVGMNPDSQGLRVADGITYIKVGQNHLDLPAADAVKEANLTQRVNLALVRMMVFGSAMALTGRGGSIHLDEAWVFLGAGKSEVERLGRLARSQGVLPELYTQRVSDAVNAGLSGYISRGFILPIEDREEAKAACELFKLEPTPARLGRITAKGLIGDGKAQTPNWNSMRALRDPKTNKVVRGAIGIYVDLGGRAIPTEVVLPPKFLKLSSTNPEDIKARRMESLAAQATQQPVELAIA